MADLSNMKMTDHLMHIKTDNEEMIAFPFTRYDNVFGSPKIVTDLTTFKGAPFFFYQTDEVEVEDDVVNTLIGVEISSV